MRYYKKLVCLLGIFLLSCSKQESPPIENGEVRSQREIERLDACTRVNFDKGVLLHLNTIYLFKCAKWDEDFPSLFASIKRIPGDSWDHIMAPVDKVFIESLPRRNKLFKDIRDLDAENGLDDLSRVIVALNETNFFDSVKIMFQCVENPSLEICDERQGKVPPKKALKNIIEFVDTSPETIDSIMLLSQDINKSIGIDKEKLRDEVLKFIHDPIFMKMRLAFVDSLASKVKSGFSDEDRTFLGKILRTSNASGNIPWIYSWIHDEKMNREKFRDLVEFPILTNPDFVKELRGVKKAYDNNFECTIRNAVDPNTLVDFDFKSHFGTYVTILKNQDYKSYFDFTAEQIVGLKMSVEICKELETNNYNVNFIRALSRASGFMGEKKFYELIKFLSKNTTARGDVDKSFAENLYLFDLFASNVFSSANCLSAQIINHTRNFYPTVFDLILRLPPETYLNVGFISNDFLKLAQDHKLKGLADFWNFFSADEKNFLFNFVDRHFEDGTNFPLLFGFYAKILAEVRDTQPYFREKWVENDQVKESSYVALQDFFYQLAGASTLKDFKKFFGRDHILKILEIISSGAKINSTAKDELEYIRSNEYLLKTRSERYKFSVSYNPAKDIEYDSKAVLECMQKFAELDGGFYQLVRRLPESCTKVTDENIAFRLFGWLNIVEKEYLEFKNGNTESDSLLSNKGILSPYMLNTTIGSFKILDNLLGDVGSQVPTKNGVRYLMSSTREHLFENGASTLVEKNIGWLNRWLETLPEENLIHRNALVKLFTRDKVYSQSSDVVKHLSNVSILYGDWVRTGQKKKAEERSLGEYDPKFNCDNVVNKNFAPNPCPSKDIIKKHSNAMMKYLTSSWDPKVGSPIMMILKAIKPGEGLDIPLKSEKPERFRLTLKETLKYLYDTSDKSFPVNRQKTTYVNENGKTFFEELTTLERVEIVIRDVRFDNNYLGAAFLNSVTHAEDYNKEVNTRKSLLSKCLKIPGIRCARKMTNDQLRMANNALKTFDSLLDIDNGRGLDPKLKYGKYLKTFEQILVATSDKEAQKVQLFPLKDEELLKHNGRFLAESTTMSTWINAARFIRDRVGRTRGEFEKFIASNVFNRVDKALIKGFDLNQAGPSAERLLKKLQIIPAVEKQNFLEESIDWFAGLNYDQMRLVEDTAARLLLISAYLGSPEEVFPDSENAKKLDVLNERYNDNNIFQLFLSLEKILDHWPTLKNYFPADMKLIEAFKPINTFLVFVTDQLESTNNPAENIAYLALNDVYAILHSSVFQDLGDPRIATLNNKTVKGLDLILSFMQSPESVTQTYFSLRDNYRYLDKMHVNNANWFKAIGENLRRMVLAERLDLTPTKDYLEFTTKSSICLDDRMGCLTNYHFDEPANLVKILNKKNQNNEMYVTLMAKKVLVESFDQLTKMIDNLMPSLKIKEVKPPLKFL